MHWRSRSSMAPSPSKPTRFPDTKVFRESDILSQRPGVLGGGATIVRTPEDALRNTGVRLTYVGKAAQPKHSPERNESVDNIVEETAEQIHLLSNENCFSSPHSPHLPLSPPAEDELNELEFSVSPKSPRKTTQRPLTSPPPPSAAGRRTQSSTRASCGGREHSPKVPLLPPHTSPLPSPPPFEPVLVSDIPPAGAEPSQVIVAVETCTTTYKTTLRTIQSRPSHLSTYLTSLLPRLRNHSLTSSSSIYSTPSARDETMAYQRHLTSRALTQPLPSNIHIFLDRPSAPYEHIFHYMRTNTLSRSIRFHQSSQARLEMLLELRDEALFLGIEDLTTLCVDQIRLCNARSLSSNLDDPVHSLNGSIHNLYALLERVEGDLRSHRHSCNSDRQSKDSLEAMITPPTPQSLNGHSRGTSSSRHPPHRQPHSGWI